MHTFDLKKDYCFSMKLHLHLIIVSTALILLACTHTPPEPPPFTDGGNGGGNTLQPCDPDSVYFSQDILPLIVSSCAIPGCHDPATAEDGVILNNYENIMNTGEVQPFDPNDSEIYEVITETDPDDKMPPPDQYDSLTPEEIELIKNWILQGALNNNCASACDTMNVTYNLSIKPLIDAKCAGCHSGANPQGDLLLTNYNEVSGAALFGSILDAVQHTGGVTPMPYNSAMLPDCEIDLIRIWIENGAPE